MQQLSVCWGIGDMLMCGMVEGVLINDMPTPPQYRKWELERTVYDPKEDKIYQQVRSGNITKVIVW